MCKLDGNAGAPPGFGPTASATAPLTPPDCSTKGASWSRDLPWIVAIGFCKS